LQNPGVLVRALAVEQPDACERHAVQNFVDWFSLDLAALVLAEVDAVVALGRRALAADRAFALFVVALHRDMRDHAAFHELVRELGVGAVPCVQFARALDALALGVLDVIRPGDPTDDVREVLGVFEIDFLADRRHIPGSQFFGEEMVAVPVGARAAQHEGELGIARGTRGYVERFRRREHELDRRGRVHRRRTQAVGQRRAGLMLLDPLLGLIQGPAVGVLFGFLGEPVRLQHHRVRVGAFESADDDGHAVLEFLGAERVRHEVLRVADAVADFILRFVPNPLRAQVRRMFHGLGFAADEEPFERVGVFSVARGDRVMVLVRPHARIPPVRGDDLPHFAFVGEGMVAVRDEPMRDMFGTGQEGREEILSIRLGHRDMVGFIGLGF